MSLTVRKKIGWKPKLLRGGADFHGDNMRPTYGGADR